MTDLGTRIRSTFADVADKTPIRPLPQLSGGQEPSDDRLRRRRIATSIAASCVVVGAGLSVSAAQMVTGPTQPQGHAFGFDTGEGGPNSVPRTEHRILTVSGPNGTTLRLDYADSTDGGYCLRHSDDKDIFGEGVTCLAQTTSFGRVDQMTGVGPDPQSLVRGWGTTEFVAHVPGAVSVRVVFDDGTSTSPLPVAREETIGWITNEQTTQRPMLVGYDDHGTVVGSTSLMSPVEQKYVDCNFTC